MGGPTLNWYEVQPTVFAAEGDVLLILDCCYAAQAARGRENRVVELLAASGLRHKTPSPGEHSFTSILMTVMGRMLRETGHVVVNELYKRLFLDTGSDEEVHEQPFHFFLAEGAGSIVLRPTKTIELPRDDTIDHPMALLSLTISLSQRPDKPAIKRLSLWLKTAAPRFISAIAVGKLLTRTESIQEFLQSIPGSDLQRAIAEDLRNRGQVDSLTFGASSAPGTGEYKGSTKLKAEAAVQQIESWNDQVYQSMQSNMFLNPAFATPEGLEKVQLIESAKALGLSEAARLRILNKSSDERADFDNIRALPQGLVHSLTPPKSASTSKATETLSYGYIEDQLVIIEYRKYEDTDSQQKALPKLKRLATLLNETTDPAFHLAPFVGYVHQPVQNRSGLVFKTGLHKNIKDTNRHISLYNEYVRTKFVPLNHRYEIAIALARTLSTLHAVGWLHKGFCSDNILFFASNTNGYDKSGSSSNASNCNPQNHPQAFDLSQPRIFGFDLSRPIAGTSDQTREFRHSRLIYTHPKRWGRPAELFGQVHDIYALGVTLLEVGCWRQAGKMDRKGRAFRDCNHEEQVREELLMVAREQLPHMAGEQYSRAVVTCLDDSLDGYVTDGQDASRLHKAFGKLVLDVLMKAANNL